MTKCLYSAVVIVNKCTFGDRNSLGKSGNLQFFLFFFFYIYIIYEETFSSTVLCASIKKKLREIIVEKFFVFLFKFSFFTVFVLLFRFSLFCEREREEKHKNSHCEREWERKIHGCFSFIFISFRFIFFCDFKSLFLAFWAK